MDSWSTISIIVPRHKPDVRTLVYLSAGIIASVPAWRELIPQLDFIAAGLAQDWWIFPLAASSGSLVVLATATVLRLAQRENKPTRILTGAYLVSGPSMATLGLSSLLPFRSSCPTWVGPTMLVLLLSSAWIYYRSSGDSDEKDPDFQPGSLIPSIP